MEKRGCGPESSGPVLVVDQHDLVSVSDGQMVLRSRKQLRVNARYRVKSVRKLPDFNRSARVDSCSLQIARDDEGRQVPVYEAVLELCEE